MHERLWEKLKNSPGDWVPDLGPIGDDDQIGPGDILIACDGTNPLAVQKLVVRGAALSKALPATGALLKPSLSQLSTRGR